MAPVNKHSCKHCETALNCVSYIDFRSLVTNCRGLRDVYVVNDANLVGHSKFPTEHSLRGKNFGRNREPSGKQEKILPTLGKPKKTLELKTLGT
jgi:hypothetical protein